MSKRKRDTLPGSGVAHKGSAHQHSCASSVNLELTGDKWTIMPPHPLAGFTVSEICYGDMKITPSGWGLTVTA